ncbi:CotY/CotZ family spore coat protein [Natribacillus halophilus]|uniref:Spore coat protein Y n=1 Tax=Natribacillus halophilus TaxID=549003 RepID=A0A1G8LE84_9BACI|nr:CotY/CotZ family spore coat protein [Natribacillus halophilus]SDI54004.1 spore coat protein Y [Natribacillus halophilus]
MSCGCKDYASGHCVCDAVLSIKEAQDAVDKKFDDCVNSCFTNLLGPKRPGKVQDTIPFMLKDKKSNLFWATGGLTADYNDVFETVFFRVENVDEKTCCATLSLLRPIKDIKFTHNCCVDPTSLSDVYCLEKTHFCIEVDLNCFCAIQCLDPDLVDNHAKRPDDRDKKHHHHEK